MVVLSAPRDGEALLAMAEEMGKAAKSREEDGNAA